MAWGSSPVFGFNEHNFGTGSFTCAAFDSTGADTIWVAVAGNPTIGTPTDNKGNTYVAVRTQNNAFGDPTLRFFVAIAPTVGTGHTITVAVPDGNRDMAVIGFAGGHATAVADQNNGTGQVFVTISDVGSITPSGNNYLLLAPVSASNFSSVDSGYAVGTGTIGELTIVYKILAVASAANPSVTLTAQATHFVTIHASFIPAAGGGGGGGVVAILMMARRMMQAWRR